MAAGFKSGGRAKGVPNKATVAKRGAGKVDLSSLAGAREVDLRILPMVQNREVAGLPPAPAYPLHRVEQVELLVRYTNNARTHTDESVDRLCALIKEFGWTNPILVAGLDILAGHRRLSAALKLGLDVVPVIDLSHLSPLQRRAYILADNKSALDAGWDEGLLSIELGEIKDAGFDLALTGFDAADFTLVTAPDSSEGEPASASDGNVCCPQCGHEFKTVSKLFRKIALRG